LRKGYDYLAVSFVATVIAAFASKIGAITLDKLLFIFISYGLGCAIAFLGHAPDRKRLNKEVKNKSMKFGILLGVINFLSYFTILSALEAGPGATIFPIVGLNVAFIVLLSMLLFKERLNVRGIVGFVLALIAILLLR